MFTNPQRAYNQLNPFNETHVLKLSNRGVDCQWQPDPGTRTEGRD